MKKAYNCWEIQKCGREPGGSHVIDKGFCPVTLAREADTINRGKNGGRCCWVIAGTFCNGEVAGSVAQKIDNCLECTFYQKVRDEEGKDFKMTQDILKELKKKK